MTRIGTGAITDPRIELSKTAQKNAARDARKIVNEWHASGIVDVSANCQHPDNAVNDAEAWVIESSRECADERFSRERSANSDRDVHTRYREEIEHLVIASLGGWNAIADALSYERSTHGVNDVCPDCNGNGRTWGADGNRWCTACNTATRIMLAHKPEYPVDEYTVEMWIPAYTDFPYYSGGRCDSIAEARAYAAGWIRQFPDYYRFVIRHPDGTGELYPATPDTSDTPAPLPRPRLSCDACSDQGIVNIQADGTYEYCSCRVGVRVRASDDTAPDTAPDSYILVSYEHPGTYYRNRTFADVATAVSFCQECRANNLKFSVWGAGADDVYRALAPVELAPDTATELETQALIIARVLLVNAGYTAIAPNVPPTQDDIAHAVNVLDMSGFDVDFLHSK